MLVLRTLGAPQRRSLRRRRGRTLAEAGAEPVPTTRATLVRPAPFSGREEAEEWLSGIRGDRERADEELAGAVARLNRALHAHRVAAADPYAHDLSASRALVARIGYGSGDAVADGRFTAAWELPRGAHARARRSMEAPEERFAAILTGRETALPSEDLVLRARTDLDAGRTREAALQARVALESLLGDLSPSVRDRGDLEADRGTVGEAANAALRGPLAAELAAALAEAVARMEGVLKRRRLGG